MNFKKAISRLIHQRATNPRVHSLEVDEDWTLIFCPQTKHFYAMEMTSASCIRSSISSIRPAFRIDPATGGFDPKVVNRNGEPRKFAIKTFSGDKAYNLGAAENEREALDENQPTDKSFTNDGQPIIIMEYHPGETICSMDGRPNELLQQLSLQDRLALILQITNQFYEIHAFKLRKKARIHIDVKGANIVIDVPAQGPINARVIDFGSAKVLTKEPLPANEISPDLAGVLDDPLGHVSTTLAGLTLMTAPPEAVSAKLETQFVELGDETGYLSTKSDVYSLGSVFAVLLGANNPYAHRGGEIVTADGLCNVQLLKAQMAQGFDLAGLLGDGIPKLPFLLPTISQPCAFRNFSAQEAPNDDSILEDKALPQIGYVLYKNQFLYVNKERRQVAGRDIASKPRVFNPRVAAIKEFKDTNELTPISLSQCIGINGAHPQNKGPIDDTLRPLIARFIDQMTAYKAAERPSREEVLRFFTVANKLAVMATIPDHSRTRTETELRIQIALLQLNIIVYKGWHIKLPLLLPDNTISTQAAGSFAQFDFDSLEQNAPLFNQLTSVFCDQEIIEGRKTLTEKIFQFLHIPNEEKIFLDAVVTKLQGPAAEDKREEKQAEPSYLSRKVLKLLLDSAKTRANVSTQRDDEKAEVKNLDEKLPAPSVLSGAAQFLSFSKGMTAYLLEEKMLLPFAQDFNLKKEFLEHIAYTTKHKQPSFLETHFPAKFAEIKAIENLANIEILRKSAPNITLFLSHDLDNDQQVAELLDHQCQVKQGTPLTLQAEAKLFELHQEMLQHKKHILRATSQNVVDKLNNILTKPRLEELQRYISNLQTLQDRGVTYQRFSFFGMFGHTVAEKLVAARKLETAIKTGKHQGLLDELQRNKALNAALTGKTLGSISKSHLSCMKTNRRNRSAIMR